MAALAATGGLPATLRRTWKLLVVLLIVTTLIWSLFLKLGERKEINVARPIRIIKGAYFLIVNPIFPPRFDRNAG